MDYSKIFERNNKTNDIIVDVALDDYMDLYHEWDNTRFKKRDINPELIEFLSECSEQIPLKENLELRFNIEKESKDEKKEKQGIESYGNYLKASIFSIKAVLKNMYRIALGSVILAFVLLIVAYIGKEIFEEGLITSVILEGFDIGAWVFMWEAVYALGYSRIDEKKKYKQFKRLLNSSLVFTYTSENI